MESQIQKHLKILNLKQNQINEEVLRKHYFKKALQYHPDKNNSKDAKSNFHEINESYEFLMKYYGYMDDETTFDIEEDETVIPSYNNTLYNYMETIINTELFKNIQAKIMELIKEKCEHKAFSFIKTLDCEKIKKLITILNQSNKQLFIPDDFINKINEIYNEKNDKIKKIVIYPTLNDIFLDNLYKLIENNEEYLIPLWHHELLYDTNDYEFMVEIIPKLDNNIKIDNDNHLHVYLSYMLHDLWKKSELSFSIDNHKFIIPKEKINFVSNQTICLSQKGISKINTTNVYDISKKSDLYVHITIVN